jgi:hypothetical protein
VAPEKIPNHDLWSLTNIFIRETVHRLLHIMLGFGPANIDRVIKRAFDDTGKNP